MARGNVVRQSPPDLSGVFYRGEISHPDTNHLRSRTRAFYFSVVDVANRYADPALNPKAGSEDTARIYPVRLSMRKPFVNQPNGAYLELSDVAARLGLLEAMRIALKFEQWIVATDQWQERINADGRYQSVDHYLRTDGELSALYFQAYPFFADTEEVGKLIERNYDGAVHAGNGCGSEGFPEYCVFNTTQIRSIFRLM
jgi:hypothetical protein